MHFLPPPLSLSLLANLSADPAATLLPSGAKQQRRRFYQNKKKKKHERKLHNEQIDLHFYLWMIT